MTVEEIEIIVTAKVEDALREFMKIVPAIKQQMKQAQEAFSKVDTKTMTNKLHQAVQFMKKKMQDLKKSSQNNEIAIKVNNNDAQKQINQIQKQIDSLQEKINARQMKLNVITPRLDEITAKTTKEVTPDGINADSPAIQSTVNNSLNSNKEYTSLLAQETKMTQEISMYNKQLSEAKSKMSQLGQTTKQTATTQSKLSGFFGTFKEKIEKTKPILDKIGNSFKFLPKITQKITNHIKGMGTGIKQGLGHILKYAGALFSIRGIYSVLSNSASSWLSSQNAGAKQLSTNIDYLKNSFGSVLAPVIQYVVNLIYQLMKAIQSVVYALFRVNIFAGASAKNYASMAGSAKKAKNETKQLAGIHDELNNIQSNSNSDSGSSGGTPSFDLSDMDNQMSPLAQKLYDFFKPLVDSWNTYGQGVIDQFKITISQIGELLSSVWGSFEKIITNGTVYTTLQLILAIIGNIAEAFANAWNYNGNGDAIVQNLANAFNNLLGAINNVVQSEGFQNWLNNCSDKFRVISEKLSEIDWQPLVDALTSIGTNLGTLALDILSGLVDIFKWLAENPEIAEIILAIAVAIGVVSTILGVLSTIMGILTPIATAFGVSITSLILPILAIIAVIAAVIAIIILCIQHWEEIKTVVMNVVNAIVEFITNLWNQVSFIFEAIWNVISTIFSAIWEVISTILGFVWNLFATVFQAIWDIVSPILNAIWQIISTIFQAIWNIISTILGSIWNIFSQIFNWIWQLISTVFNAIWNIISPIINAIWNAIKNALNSIQQIWSNVWETISNVVRNVWNGIWNCIKGVINCILGGIEGFVNGVIKGINFLLSGLSNVANAVGSLIGLDPINLKISTISLPRLAKGGVLTEATAVIAGEYSGAKSNPEIVTPQNIMEDTFDRVFSRHEGKGNSDRPIYLTVNVSNKKLGQILLEDLRDMKRRTGKDIEALVGG